MISLFEKYPHLKDQWSDKNTISPDSISRGSSQKAWRKLPCGHEFQQAINAWRIKGCPVCSGKLIQKGVNDFSSAHPHLVSQWSDKNSFGPETVGQGSGQKAWRKPPCGHEFEQVISDWCDHGCPICSGNLLVAGINDFATNHPELISQWSSKNTFGPDEVSHGSNKKAWRAMECGHEFEQSIKSWKRLGCPVCKGLLIIHGINDFSTTHPELAKQWSDKNATGPESVSHGSNKKAWRKPPCGHEFEQIISGWENHGCPVCSGFLVIPGVNDLTTTHPELAKQWSDKNTIRLDSVGCGSSQKAWRIHPCGHEFEQLIKDWKNYGCQKCATLVSKAEQELFDFVKAFCPDAQQSNRTLIAPREIDIYIPSKKIAIEFNGLYWHSENFVDKNYHYDKWLACKNEGVQLITIWEDQWNNNQDVVKKMLKAKLVGEAVILARNVSLNFITYQEASNFLNSWHIQGSCTGRFYIGLFNKETLIGVCVISKTGELRRYASSISIIGGLDKCLKFSGLNDFYTFADHCVSAGGIYESTGWKLDSYVPPKCKHVTKHGLFKVYDCGKTRYTKSLV